MIGSQIHGLVRSEAYLRQKWNHGRDEKTISSLYYLKALNVQFFLSTDSEELYSNSLPCISQSIYVVLKRKLRQNSDSFSAFDTAYVESFAKYYYFIV